MHALIIGCGYLGRRIARLWRKAGHDVSALTRSEKRAAELAASGISPVVGDVLEPESLSALPESDVTLYSVGYDRTSGAERGAVVLDGLSNVLAALTGRTGGLIFVSTTSVYGASADEWVDEESPCQPVTEGGRVGLRAEERVRQFLAEQRAGWGAILRLSGIYGPGRLIARIDALHKQEPLAVDPEGWLNLVHVDDAAAVAVLLEDRRPSAVTWLATDDRPLRRREFYETIARLVDAPPPQFVPPADPDSRGSGPGRRCCNARLKQLGWRPKYPTIDTGLPQALAGE